jgi:nicotinamide-nucleotide amidase
MTSGVGESFLAEKIKDWEEALPENIKLAYLPNLSQVRLRLTGFGADESVVRSQIQEQVAKLLPLIQQHVYALEDTQIEVVIGKELLQRSKTIGTAESCTGGYIAHKITSVPGSSQWFMGSVIAYQNKLKETLLHVNENTLQTHGAVSEETVIEMATHARTVLKSDYAIAVSGIAGPDGGTAEKPTGLVWIAIADADKVYSRKFQFLRSRLQNIEMTANQALFMLYKILKGTYES